MFDRRALPFVLVATVFASGCTPETSTNPNIILIVSDDAGYVDFGFQGRVPTPNIDALALAGIRFTQGYVSASVCSPSRAGLMTGRYQQRFGHEGNLSDPSLGLPISEHTIADVLKAEGYATVAVGKWHLGYEAEYHPGNRGFDEFFGTLAGSRSYFAVEGGAAAPRRVLHDQREIAESDLTYLTDDLGSFAANYIRRDRADPFFMYLAFTAPHTPMQATDTDLAEFETVEDVQRRTYLAMTHALDRAVGQVVESLRETDQFENTFIVFINDNGGATNNASDNGPLRGMKGSKWEGGIRVPFFVHWPNGLTGGRTYDSPVIALDILPTVLAASGGETDASRLDGVNLLPFLNGGIEADPHEALFWRRYVATAVRRGPWKLIRVESNETVLVNLQDDPGETDNVASQYPELVSELSALIDGWERNLVEPLWFEGEPWRSNQIRKHQMDVIGREMERIIP